MLDDLSRIKSHQQALAGALRMPDHSRLAVALRRARRQRACHRMTHCVELVVACEYLCNVTAGIAKHDKVLDQIKKAAALEYALEDRLQLRRALRCNILTCHRPPRHEAFAVSGE